MHKYFDEEIEKNANEKFKKHIVDILTIKDSQISDLEAKLAESEKKILELQEDSIRDNQIYNEQLAECEKERDGNYENYSICWKENEQLKQQLEENDAYKLRIELAGADETISQLKQQLAEKEKEIESLKASSDKNIDYLIEFASLIENEKDCNRMLKALDRVKKGKKYIVDKEYQDKISFAVEQLEKVLKTLEEKQFYKKEDTAYCVHPAQIAEYIDNQIKQLKEGK